MARVIFLSTGAKQMALLVGVVMGVLLSLSLARVSTQRVLCGKTLADTLDLVCSGRGFNFHKRSDVAKDTGVAAAKDWAGRAKRTMGRMGNVGPVRSVVDECCRRPCTYSVLESYCAPIDHVQEFTEEQMRQLAMVVGNRQQSTLTSTLYTTTQSTAHVDSNSPSAEVHRGPSRGRGRYPQNASFFFLDRPRPTRNSLVENGGA